MIKIGDYYQLTPAEVSSVKDFVEQRNSFARRNNIKDQFISGNIENDYIGGMGQFAFSKLNGEEPDLKIGHSSKAAKTDKFDAKIDGKTIEVRTTYKNAGVLYAREKDKKYPPDYFGLMVKTSDNGFTFRGFAPAWVMFNREPKLMGLSTRPPVYQVAQLELKNFNEWE